MSGFYSRLNYSFGNEDWITEQQALQIRPSDRLVCITASGERPLNLLTRDCHEIISVDANPTQNHLLRLKISAIKAFSYEEYMKFLGLEEDERREEKLHSLKNSLEEASFQFWQKNVKMIKAGVIYQGTTERLTSKTAKIFKVLRGRQIKKLFSFDDLEEQRNFVLNEWDKAWWRHIVEKLWNPKFARWLLDDPGTYNHLDPNISIGSYTYRRMHASLLNGLAKQNPLLALLLLGRVPKEGYSPYLTRSGFAIIKARLDKIKIVDGCVVTLIGNSPANSYDCFSLSDAASYMPHSQFIQLLNVIALSARPQARFCIRQFMSAHQIPSHLESHFIRDLPLEKELEQQDRCFVYRFFAGSIHSKAS